MFEITEWDGTLDHVIANFEGNDVVIRYLVDEEAHRVTARYFWSVLQARSVEVN